MKAPVGKAGLYVGLVGCIKSETIETQFSVQKDFEFG